MGAEKKRRSLASARLRREWRAPFEEPVRIVTCHKNAKLFATSLELPNIVPSSLPNYSRNTEQVPGASKAGYTSRTRSSFTWSSSVCCRIGSVNDYYPRELVKSYYYV